MKENIIQKPTDPRFIDLEGLAFGRLKVLNLVGQTTKGQFLWSCICECGTYKPKVHGGVLRSGRTKSCGCYRDQKATGKTTHDMSRSVEYSAYMHARDRCRNPNSKGYKCYGKRGIEFRFTSFEQFLEEVGLRPSLKHSINRIDKDGHYEPGNVEWATVEKQVSNRRPGGPGNGRN